MHGARFLNGCKFLILLNVTILENLMIFVTCSRLLGLFQLTQSLI